jgi:hypothetical protein
MFCGPPGWRMSLWAHADPSVQDGPEPGFVSPSRSGGPLWISVRFRKSLDVGRYLFASGLRLVYRRAERLRPSLAHFLGNDVISVVKLRVCRDKSSKAPCA